MRLALNLTGTVLKVNEDSFHDDKANKDVPYWKVVIDQGKDVASISITKDVADKLKQKLYCEYGFDAEFDTEKSKLRITGAELLPSKAVK